MDFSTASVDSSFDMENYNPNQNANKSTKAGGSNNKSKKTVEETHQKKTQLEHILLRPDTYIGFTQSVTQPMFRVKIKMRSRLFVAKLLFVTATMLLLQSDKATTMLLQSMTMSGQDPGEQQMTKKLALPPVWYEIEEGGITALRKANEATFSMPDEEDWLLSKPYYNKEDHFQKHEQLIPKYLHKVIITATGDFPDYFDSIVNATIASDNDDNDSPVKGSLAHAHVSWRKLNPGYVIRYFNLHLCREYLKQYYHPIFLRAFDCIEAFAGKSDLFRTLVVYREGGFYSDWKEECKINLLKQLSSENTTWFSAFNKPGGSDAMANAFFGALPGSPILAESIRITLHNIQNNRGDKLVLGPGVLGDAFFNVGRRLGWDLPSGKQRNQGWDRIPGVRLGDFMHGWGQRFMYNGTTIILHKCDSCEKDQNWNTGNNYNDKFAAGEYLCPDAESLFLPKENNNQTVKVRRKI